MAAPVAGFRLATAVGLASGLVEALIYVLRRAAGEPQFLDPRVVWMAPVADAAMLGALWGLILIASRASPRLKSERAALLVLGFAAVVSVLLAVNVFNAVAVGLLGAGIAWQANRWLGPRLGLLIRPAVLICTIITASVLVVHEGQRLSGARSVVAPTGDRVRPNVILIVLDTVRASNLGLYGYSRDTSPGLVSLARSGATFRRAISTSSWTLPAHGSLFTGRGADELSASWLTPLDGKYPTLAEYLRSHGYATGGFVGNTVYASAEFGLDRGFSHYDDFTLAPSSIVLGSALLRLAATDKGIRELIGYHQLVGRRSAEDINRDLLSWIAGLNGHPFFAFLNYYDAHDPYLPPEPFATRFQRTRPRGYRLAGRRLSPDALRELVNAYDGALAYVDRQVAALVEELERRGELARTLVVVTSDHGEEFDEHGLMGHGNSLYIESLHVPLLLVLAGRVPAAVEIEETDSLRDVPATIVDLLELGSGSPFPGSSLARYWQGGAVGPDREVRADVLQSRGQPAWYPVMRGRLTSIVADGLQYIHNWGDGQEELFDVERDRAGRSNRAARQEFGTRLREFRDRIGAEPRRAHQRRDGLQGPLQ
jgi:arylsulfatase A-like enzyme